MVFALLASKAENHTGEIGKLLGAKWKEMLDDDKKPYLDQAAKDKERAEREKDELLVCNFSQMLHNMPNSVTCRTLPRPKLKTTRMRKKMRLKPETKKRVKPHMTTTTTDLLSMNHISQLFLWFF